MAYNSSAFNNVYFTSPTIAVQVQVSTDAMHLRRGSTENIIAVLVHSLVHSQFLPQDATWCADGS